MKALPDPEGTSEGEAGQGEGIGGLAKNLEFLLIKVAQLEALAEFQGTKIEHLEKHLGMESPSSGASLAQSSQETMREAQAQAIFKRVFEKHARQRETRQYHSEALRPKQPEHAQEPPAETVEDPEKDAPVLLQAHQGCGICNAFTGGVVGAVNRSGDHGGACPSNFNPKLWMDGTKIKFEMGRQHCRGKLFGEWFTLFNFKVPGATVDLKYLMNPEYILDILPEPIRDLASAPLAAIKAQMALAKGLVGCIKRDSSGILECLGSKIIEMVPPFNYLTKMGDILTEVIEVFAKVASTVVQKAMEQGPSLVQTAATAKLPAAGEPPLQHHKSTNLIVESHTRHAPPGSFLHRELAAVQTNTTRNVDSGGDDPDGAITYNMGSGGDVQATQLFTQFDGRETDTSSCLAFAPKNRKGSGASKTDWQVRTQDDFLKLEPWAVPCDNAWMKDNINKWQGYSFYFGQKAIEKCVTVTFSLGMQPVVAFVGGLQFEVLPKPLFELATTVCWPNKQPGGVDLSVLRSEIKSAGILLFSRTLRLSKRFGANTDFSAGNIKGSYETWRSPAGIAKGESRAPMDALKRSSLLQGNRSHVSRESKAEAQAEAEMEQQGLQWKAETEDLYLASVDYGEHMNTSVDKTFEAYGEEAARRMGASSGLDDFKLFRFKSPGLVNFEIEGLMSGNTLQLGMEMTFGPYKSPPKKIPLVDIGKQFALILAGLPFVSTSSKETAIEALKDFSMKDAGRTQGLPVALGSVVALFSPHTGRYLKMSGSKLEPSPPMYKWGIPDHWTSERFTVVDAGNGEIALHNEAQNRFMGTGDASPPRDIDALPSSWLAQVFTVREEGNGEVALYNRRWHKKCVSMSASGVGSSSSCGTESRFVLVPAERLLTPGTMIALHSTAHNRFVRMNGQHLGRSDVKDAADLPSDWVSERFTVVDAGHGQIALHNAVHNRFVGLGISSPHRFVDQLPGDWLHERFDVYPAGHGEIVLHSRNLNKMLRMSTVTIDTSPPLSPATLPDGWTWERFRVVRLKPYLEPGTMVALRCKAHGRYVTMKEGIPLTTSDSSNPFFNPGLAGRIVRSNVQSESGIPDRWTFERFTVVDAGNGQVAFHNSRHNRFITMADHQLMCVSLTSTGADAYPMAWTWQRFTVVPVGGGQFAFHNSAHNRFIRMSNSDFVDASGSASPQDLQVTWNYLWFQIRPAKPYVKPGTVVALHNSAWKRFILMTGAAVTRSAAAGVDDLLSSWADALFTVVDAGYGQVAFHNSKWNRFVKMNGASMATSLERAADELPADSKWERFAVAPAHQFTNNGEFFFHNTAHNRVIRMSSLRIDTSPPKQPQEIPASWTWERFRIVEVSDPSTKIVHAATFD